MYKMIFRDFNAKHPSIHPSIHPGSLSKETHGGAGSRGRCTRAVQAEPREPRVTTRAATTEGGPARGSPRGKTPGVPEGQRRASTAEQATEAAAHEKSRPSRASQGIRPRHRRWKAEKPEGAQEKKLQGSPRGSAETIFQDSKLNNVKTGDPNKKSTK